MEYVVQRGDTLSSIAARFGTTYQAIAQANNIRNVNLIFVGQRLQIPSASGRLTTENDFQNFFNPRGGTPPAGNPNNQNNQAPDAGAAAAAAALKKKKEQEQLLLIGGLGLALVIILIASR
jgi:LysM repeat protein